MVPRFGRSIPEMSLILTEVTDFIVVTHDHLLGDLDQPTMSSASDIAFARAALDNCWGFVNGTVRPIFRPREHQRVMYNGHKRVHGLKFNSVVTQDGFIVNLFDPVGVFLFLNELHGPPIFL